MTWAQMGFYVFAVVTASAALFVGTPFIGFKDERVFLSMALVATALITFFGSLPYGAQRNGTLPTENIRTAITVSVVTVYLVLVSIVAFFVGDGDEGLPDITEAMVTSFTALVAIVVPSYFGASAYVQVKRQQDGEEREQPPTREQQQGGQQGPRRGAEPD